MEHGDYHVQLLNEQGYIVGGKRRADVDKVKDIVRVVHVLLFLQDRRIVLSTIPLHATAFGGKLGSTAASLVRVGEFRHDAANRALAKELYVTRVKPHLLGEAWDRFDDLAARRTATFVGLIEVMPNRWNPDDCAGLTALTRVEIEERLRQPELFATSFLHIWERYQRQFAF